MPMRKGEAGLGLCLVQAQAPQGFGKGRCWQMLEHFPPTPCRALSDPFPPAFLPKAKFPTLMVIFLTLYWCPVASGPCRWESKLPCWGWRARSFLGNGGAFSISVSFHCCPLFCPDSHWWLAPLLAKSGRGEPAETHAKSWLLSFFLPAFSFDIWETNLRYSQTR